MHIWDNKLLSCHPSRRSIWDGRQPHLESVNYVLSSVWTASPRRFARSHRPSEFSAPVSTGIVRNLPSMQVFGFFRHWWVPSTKHQDCINPRSRILTMENNRGSSSKRSIEQCVAPVPPAPARRSCLKKTGKKGIRPTMKNCVSFDLGKNEVWTIKDWTLPITLQRRETSSTARIQEGWVFDEGGVDVVMTDVWII